MITRLASRLGDQEFAVIGLGRFGSALALRLESLGHSVLGVDINQSIVQRVADELTAAVSLDATDQDALETAGVGDFNTVIVAMGGVFEAAALCVAALKNMGVPTVIVQASSDQHRQLLLRIGADKVVQPLQSGGERLAEELAFPLLLRELRIGNDYTVAKIAPPPKFIQKQLAELNLRDAYNINVLLIKRNDDIIVTPSSTTRLQENDELVILGPKESIIQLVDQP